MNNKFNVNDYVDFELYGIGFVHCIIEDPTYITNDVTGDVFALLRQILREENGTYHFSLFTTARNIKNIKKIGTYNPETGELHSDIFTEIKKITI